MRTVNLGILAHVDAGKTSLTERLLYSAGVIDEIGSVDDGNTQTDSLALERQRGITIKSAVVSFTIGDVAVNLIDTPGHPDFIAEVERVLSVLDGAVLVISAVEGIQAQTRVLMRTLQRLRIPTVLFVNKIDRVGADPERVVHAIAEKLTPAIVAMGSARNVGTRDAEFTAYATADTAFATNLAALLAERDDDILAAFVADATTVSHHRLRDALAMQTKQARVHPVYFGSAITGAGVEQVMEGIAELLPATETDADGPVVGSVFKVERGPAGEKIAYVRMFSGAIHARDRLQFGNRAERKVTAISGYAGGPAALQAAIVAGQIGKLWGLGDVQIGDAIGAARASSSSARRHFAPPTLETVIVPARAAHKGALHVALAQLAEQDPLINLRQDDVRQELFVSLYGEVQKEVIRDTLATDYGIDVEFRATTMICIERPVGTGAAVDLLGEPPNPFLATVGLQVEPAAAGSGVAFVLAVEVTTIPLYVYKAVEEFRDALDDTVQKTLQQGLYGWQVTDCTVTLTHSGYVPPGSTAADFRKLTPLVLMRALKQAGTVVCEPIDRFHLEIPADTLGAIYTVLARLHAVPEPPAMHGSTCTLVGRIPATRVLELQQQLPGPTRGEGVVECSFHGYRPVVGTMPRRARTDDNPLNRKEYLRRMTRRT